MKYSIWVNSTRVSVVDISSISVASNSAQSLTVSKSFFFCKQHSYKQLLHQSNLLFGLKSCVRKSRAYCMLLSTLAINSVRLESPYCFLEPRHLGGFVLFTVLVQVKSKLRIPQKSISYAFDVDF